MCDLPELKEVLNAQCTVHQKLLALEEAKTQVLLDGDPQALLPLMNEQQALLMQGREMEKRRMALCADAPFPTLREMVQSSAACKDALETVFAELSGVVLKLKKKCALNKKLLETRLSTIRFLSGQAGLDTGANTYTRNTGTKG